MRGMYFECRLRACTHTARMQPEAVLVAGGVEPFVDRCPLGDPASSKLWACCVTSTDPRTSYRCCIQQSPRLPHISPFPLRFSRGSTCSGALAQSTQGTRLQFRARFQRGATLDKPRRTVNRIKYVRVRRVHVRGRYKGRQRHVVQVGCRDLDIADVRRAT